MEEKVDLLDEVDELFEIKDEFDVRFLTQALIVIAFVLAIVFPKIYIQQQIYFMSRDIAKTKDEYDNLKEENRLIGASVEAIRFKHQVVDTIF